MKFLRKHHVPAAQLHPILKNSTQNWQNMDKDDRNYMWKKKLRILFSNSIDLLVFSTHRMASHRYNFLQVSFRRHCNELHWHCHTVFLIRVIESIQSHFFLTKLQWMSLLYNFLYYRIIVGESILSQCFHTGQIALIYFLLRKDTWNILSMWVYKSATLSRSSHSCKPCSSWTYQNSFDRSTTSWLQANNEASFLGPIASRKH